MGGQQYQEPSAYARVDYVDGEIKKHLRTCSNITDIRTILEKASEEYTKLNERVVGLEAVVKSLQEIIKGAINQRINGVVAEESNKPTTNAKIGRPPVKWLSLSEFTKMLNGKYNVKVMYGVLGRALEWAGYIEYYGGSDSHHQRSHATITTKGESLRWFRLRDGTNNKVLEINPKYAEECLELIKEYKEWLNNARRDD